MEEKKNKYTAEMIAEVLREAGTLLLVFVPLDVLFAEHPPALGSSLEALGIGFGAIMLGVGVERWRK